MTTPAQPDTGAEAAPDTGTAPANTDADETAATATEETDWKAEAEKHQALARKHEQRAKANKKALDEALAKGKPADGEPTIEDLQQKLADSDARASDAETRAMELAYKDTVRGAAATVGADPDALLDSQSFMDAVGEELDDDFDDEELREAVAKVVKKFASNPRFAGGGTAPARGGTDMGGGAPAPAAQRPKSLTEALSRHYGGRT